MKLLKSKEAAAAVDIKMWPLILDTGKDIIYTFLLLYHCNPLLKETIHLVYSFHSDDLPRKRIPQIYKPPTPEMLAYLDFSVSTTGILAGVKVLSNLSFNCQWHIHFVWD